jgi:hypothetical protein
MKELMQILIDWYKKVHYSQGDSYYVNYSAGADLWIIGHSNDYPLQHGKGKSVRLRTKEVDEIINHQNQEK